MDLAQGLVRSVVRAFFDTKHVLVVDALCVHSALRDDDLAYLMGMNTKELHKLCGKLKEARFIAVHTRPELKEGQTRPMNRTYYYMDYRATIDAIKWRIYQIDKEVQGSTVKAQDIPEWFCPRCKSEYNAMKATAHIDPSNVTHPFRCEKCGWGLERITEDNRGGHEKSTKFGQQFKFVTDLLPKIDSVVIPENTFEQAFASAVRVTRDSTNPASITTPFDAATERPTAVKGMANVAPTSIAVTLTTSDGPTAAEIAAEKERKLQNAAQNALPVHFTHSTITGEQVKFDPSSTIPALGGASEDKKDSFNSPMADGNDDEIDGYFARLKAEQAMEAEKEAEEEYETDEDEDDEFEDVVPTGSGAGTPASFGGASVGASGLTSAMKTPRSGSGSGPSTGVASPVTGPNTPNEERGGKRVRIEVPAPVKDEGADSEEEEEFEVITTVDPAPEG